MSKVMLRQNKRCMFQYIANIQLKQFFLPPKMDFEKEVSIPEHCEGKVTQVRLQDWECSLISSFPSARTAPVQSSILTLGSPA